jgi:hypothetical protein
MSVFRSFAPARIIILLALLGIPSAGPAQERTDATASAAARPASHFTVTCARRDLEALTLIEQRGQARDLPGTRLHEASLTVLDARRTCAAGGEAEALALYDSAMRRLASAPTLE